MNVNVNVFMLRSGECERLPAVGDLQEGQRPLPSDRLVVPVPVCPSNCWTPQGELLSVPS